MQLINNEIFERLGSRFWTAIVKWGLFQAKRFITIGHLILKAYVLHKKHWKNVSFACIFKNSFILIDCLFKYKRKGFTKNGKNGAEKTLWYWNKFNSIFLNCDWNSRFPNSIGKALERNVGWFWVQIPIVEYIILKYYQHSKLQTIVSSNLLYRCHILEGVSHQGIQMIYPRVWKTEKLLSDIVFSNIFFL